MREVFVFSILLKFGDFEIEAAVLCETVRTDQLLDKL